jgi:uracil-DNA glycosylase
MREEFSKPYFTQLQRFLEQELQQQTVYPPKACWFKALDIVSPEAVKVVILGQDPYHQPGQAHGLAFSVPENISLPPSLRNIFKELQQDVQVTLPSSGNLEKWAQQGVLLLNSILTVRKNEAASHRNKGWENFTDRLIQRLAENNAHIVFVLWGSYAQKKTNLLDHAKHTILQSAHPSPLSAYRGFFGSRPFSQINEALKKHAQTPISWQL